MPQVRALVALMISLLSVDASFASADPPACRVPAFTGAGSSQGADAEMFIVNNGRPCSISNFGMPGERRNPAYSGKISRAATHGTAEFVPPQAVYTPKPGFEGEDSFAYEANAYGPNGNPLFFRVRVKVFVKAH